MSIGPVYECPSDLVPKIPELALSMGMLVELQNETTAKQDGFYLFKSRLGRIIGRRYCREGVYRIWLHFTREHAFNPLYWFADFRLSNKIERMLRENGAHQCDWNDIQPDEL